ncbi:glycosyltransferase family 4 protein [Picrophilus oshimae]|uniref:Glycosyltransferase n=1 Tax=Picrophilus torridus (strain ATCC 700027 / DSM 9790 / JCM 10055 / NBRC 100828 / KAW 2/3) TaxID=1122961 RepID=Q6L2A2_PICTO|nr:glycosyltransferase family 4 protein [Picrophilus oshimae]AAT42900.1 glycosyltransferase [Picrophilus oshimae DSM 9789]SMD30786.1 Glycosyltransferase involved in cell wall bisynthesis [Picrophilus oshimae DSM 9789]
MRILEIAYAPPESGGGVERFSNGLSLYAAEKGNNVTVIISGKCNNIFNENNVNYVQLKVKSPFFRKLLFNIKVYFYAKRNKTKFDIIHINGDNGCLASKIKGIKKIMTLHGTSRFSAGFDLNKIMHGSLIWYLKHPNLTVSYYLEKYAAAKSDVVISVSSRLTEILKKIFHRDDIITINIGIDINYYKPGNKMELRNQLNLKNDAIYALWVGMSPQRKRLDFSIKLIKNSRNMHLICIGNTGTYENDDRIHIMGHVDDSVLLKYYQACDFLLLPSVSEAFSLTVIEAMACGLVPVTGKNVYTPGLKNNINSFIASSDDEYINIINKIENNPEILSKMSENAIQNALEYSSYKSFEKYLQIMDDLIHKK